MNKFIKFLSVSIFCSFTISMVYADDSTLTKTRVVIDYPATTDLEALKKDLKDAIKFRATDKTEEVNNFMPDDMPATPGDVNFPDNGTAAASSSMLGSMMSNAMTTNGQMVAMSANMKGAVYGIKGYASWGWMSNKSYEGYVGAIYPSEKGYRVYLYSFFNKTRDTAGKISDWVTSKVLTNDLDMGYSNAIQVRDKLLEVEPTGIIKRQDPTFMAQYKLSTGNTVAKIELPAASTAMISSESKIETKVIASAGK